MIQFETAQGKYLAVTLPAEAYNIAINKQVTIEGMQMLEYNTPDMLPSTLTALPPGTYTIVGIAGKLGEGECVGIVEKVTSYAYKQYHHEEAVCLETGTPYDDRITPYRDPRQSFASLRRANNIPSSALIIKIEG